MLGRLAICAAFATWRFLDTWVEFAEGGAAYFSRHDPVRAVAIPVLAWELVQRRRLTDQASTHLLFLASCLVRWESPRWPPCVRHPSTCSPQFGPNGFGLRFLQPGPCR
jgi:hypothetical protein